MDMKTLNFRLTAKIMTMPLVVAVSILIICTLAVGWVPYGHAVSNIQCLAMQLMKNHHSFINALNLQDGRITLDEKPPIFTYPFGLIELPLVIDTRDTTFQELAHSVEKLNHAVVLSRDLIIVKYQPRIFTLSMPCLSDEMIKTEHVPQIVSNSIPMIHFWLALSIILYLSVFMIVQVGCGGVAILLICRKVPSRPLTLRQSANFSVISLIPPASMHFLALRSETALSESFLIYFAVYFISLSVMAACACVGNPKTHSATEAHNLE